MAQSAKLDRVFETLRVGRRFRKRPAQKHVQDFLRHLAATGEPHSWSTLSTTTPSTDSKPVLLQDFRIPDKFRRGPQSRAPCPICSAFYPKYENGYLAWHPDDGLVRAIGHECGKDFFEGDAFSEALNIYEAEQAEQAARRYLSGACPALAEVWSVGCSCAGSCGKDYGCGTSLLPRSPRRPSTVCYGTPPTTGRSP